jgi:putative FmdB family regulatory protein
MPDYEYRCTRCGGSFVEHQSLQEHLQGKGAKCPQCHTSKVERTLGSIYVKTSKKS